MTSNLTDILRTISNGLLVPTMIILLLCIAATVLMAGALIAEGVFIRPSLKVRLPQLADKIAEKSEELSRTIEESGLLRRQKNILLEVTRHESLSVDIREALARKLLYQEEAHYHRIVKITDTISKLAPMFGLMGTLIPLGPGIVALGQGDTFTLSNSMLVAFDTTVAGLVSAAVAFVISIIRKNMYENYMTSTEVVMEAVLEALSDEE